MGTAHITLDDYEMAERRMAHETATSGITAHSIATLLVSIVLVVINATLAPGFPWSVFAVGGLLVGLFAHWWFGDVKLEEQLTRQQRKTEDRAARLR